MFQSNGSAARAMIEWIVLDRRTARYARREPHAGNRGPADGRGRRGGREIRPTEEPVALGLFDEGARFVH